METLKQLTIVESTAGMRVEGTVVFTPTAAKGDSLPPGNSYPVQVGWGTDAEGLRTLYRVLSAEVRLDLRTMRVNGRIESTGSAASFAVVRRRMVADWSSDLPTPVLLLDFLTGDPTDDQVWGAYATLTVAVAPATWRELRQTVRDAIDRSDL